MTYSSRAIAIALASVIVAVADAPAGSSYRDDSDFVSRAVAGLHLSLDERFRSADSLLSDLSAAYPHSPLVPMLAAGNVQAAMIDTESIESVDRFERFLFRAESLAVALQDVNPGDADAEFALGVIAGYRAVYESRWGGGFATLKQGLRARSHFRNALKLDSGMCDAYLGVGTYAYWKSAKSDWINWTPIVKDERSLGIEYLRRAMTCGTFTKETARAALAGALINERNFAEAIAHAETLSFQFPRAKAPLWLKAKAHFSLYEWDAAREVFDTIESRIRSVGTGNYHNLIECAYFRAHCEWGSGRYREALEECGKALTYPADAAAKVRQRERLDELKRMQRKLVKLIGS